MTRKADGKADVAFRFVFDDGAEPRLMTIRDMVLFEGIGEYARGVIHGNDVTIKAPPESLARFEREIFQRINNLEFSDRKTMYAQRNNIDAICGWAWTSDYTLVKMAPGLFD